MISHRHRCIYVKVPKCASSSVRDWLLTHGGGRHVYVRAWYPGALTDRIPRLAHALELWPGYCAFTFVRNPYRRFVSAYLHAERLTRAPPARRAQRPPTYGTLCEFAELCGELLADTRHLWGRESRSFRREHADRRYGPLGIPLSHLRFVAVHARPQVDFLPDCNPERLFGVARRRPAPLSFIGTVETLEADFPRLQALVGLPPVPLPRRNASPPAPEAVEALRLDADTRRLVEHLYAEDFAFAGYPLGELQGHASRLPRAGNWTASGGLAHPGGRPTAATRARRTLFTLAAAEIGLEARIRRTPPLRRLLSPIARLRRRFQ